MSHWYATGPNVRTDLPHSRGILLAVATPDPPYVADTIAARIVRDHNAAPDLLAALREIEPTITAMADSGQIDLDHATMIRTAIAKATA